MDTRSPFRRHLPHREVRCGIVRLTWSAHHTQPSLGDTERDIVVAVISRTPLEQARVLAGVVMDDHVHVLALARLQGETEARRRRWPELVEYRWLLVPPKAR